MTTHRQHRIDSAIPFCFRCWTVFHHKSDWQMQRSTIVECRLPPVLKTHYCGLNCYGHHRILANDEIKQKIGWCSTYISFVRSSPFNHRRIDRWRIYSPSGVAGDDDRLSSALLYTDNSESSSLSPDCFLPRFLLDDIADISI